MPHISNRKLDPEFLEKLFKKLINTLGKAHSKKFLNKVIDELFTPIEKIMLAKRLAIILLLSNKIPQHRIEDILKVSPTTIAKLSLKIEMNNYSNILAVSKKEKIDIEKIIWQILTINGIMPPKVGRKYWRKYK